MLSGLLFPSIYNLPFWVLQNKVNPFCLFSQQMDDTSLPLMPLHGLADRHYGLIPSIAGSFIDAARVCLDRHHTPPAQITITKESDEKTALVKWEPTDERTRGALANKDDATRDGAYGCIIAAVELSEGLYAVKRAETHTGADYYVAPAGKRIEDLEDCWRLEVSGTDKGTHSVVARRLREKVQQTKEGASNLPAIAGVIGFEVLSVLFEYVTEK